MSGKSGMSGRPPTTARHINAFSCPTWLSLCRAYVGHVGRARLHGDIRRDGWKGMGRMRPVGGMGDARRTGRPFPWLLAFPGVHARPVASIRGRCGGLDDTNKILRIEKPPTRPPYRGRAVRELMTNGHTKSIAILGVKSNKFISEIYFGVHFGMPYVSKRTTLT